MRRGDAAGVRRHLEVIASRAPDLVPLYRALVLAQVPMARELGDATRRFDAIERLAESTSSARPQGRARKGRLSATWISETARCSFAGRSRWPSPQSILLRGRRRDVHLLFAGVAADMGLWYLAQSLYGLFQATASGARHRRPGHPAPAIHSAIFEAIVPAPPTGPTRRCSVSPAWLAVPMLLLTLSPQHNRAYVRVTIFVYAFGLLAAGLWSLAIRGQKSGSRATKRRVSFLVVIGALAASFSLADFLWFIGAELPPVGAVLSIVFSSCWPNRCAASASSTFTRWSAVSWSRRRSRFSWRVFSTCSSPTSADSTPST